MGGFAWVTLATNDSYSLGALVLANSLKQVGTKEQLAVLVTPGVTSSMKEKLSQVFNVVYEVNILDSKDAANLRLLQRPELGITFTKLHCWRLVQFDKCVFLDADTLVLQNCDELFEREELSAAPDVGWPDCFNSGVFVFRPSNETYEKLIQFALDKGSFDGGDQGLLNLYFSDWATKDISKHLPFIYNLCSTACYSYLPAFKQFGGNAKIMHFIGASKPWLQYFDTESRKVQPSNDLRHLEGILQHWWNIFCQLIHPNLSTDMGEYAIGVDHTARSTQDVAHSSNSHHTPANSQKPRTHSKKNIAWDPWEEYDKNQSALQNPPQTEPYSHEKLIESHNTIASNVVNETPQPHTFAPPHNILPHQHHPPPPQNYVPPQQHHAHVSPLQTYIPLNNSLQSQPYIPPPQPAIPPKQSYIPPVQSQSHMTPPSQNQAQPQPHFSSQINNIPSTRDPSPPASQLTNNPSPPKNDPVPPNECEAASTVCKEITMHAPEDETNGGLAGAFAQLTLGAPRTSEQLALDDHLRRQGWEVGNIDYMGRDSFDNIWSKICQTIGTSVSSKEATPPPPPPPVEEPSPVPASEAAVPSAPEATSEPIASLPEISPSCNIQTISIEIAPITTIEPIPLPQTSIEPEKPTELIEQSPTLPPSQETSVAAQKTEKSIPATTDAPQQTTEPPKTTEAIPELSQPVVCPCKPPPPPFPEVQPTPETVPSVPKLTASPPKILSTELLIEPISPTPDVVPITEPKTDTKASETIESVKSEPELEKTISQPIQQTLQSATPISESTNIPAESKQIAPEPAKPASEPTKPATEPAKPVSEPTKPATEPAKPALEPVKPASEPVKPVSEPVKPASEPAKPTSEPVAESTKPASKLTESVKPGPEPTKPVSEPDKVVPEVQKSSSEITKPLSETIKPASKSSKPLSEPTKQISKSTKAAPEAPKPQTDAPKSTKPAAESGKTTKESPACAKPVEPLQASAASTKNVPVPESSKPEDTAAETSKTKAGDASQTSPTPPPRKTGGVKKTKAKK